MTANGSLLRQTILLGLRSLKQALSLVLMHATFAAPYAVRPKPGAPVSAPCAWDEIERGDALPQTFKLRDMAARLASTGDTWANMTERRQSLQQAREHLQEVLGPDLPPALDVMQDRFGRRLSTRKQT